MSQTFRIYQLPALECTRQGWGTHHTPGVPEIDLIRPGDLKDNLWRSVAVGLNVFSMLPIAEDRGAKVTENDIPMCLRNWQLAAGIDGSTVYFLPRGRVDKLLLLESIEDGVVADAEHDVVSLDIGLDDLAFGMQKI